MSLTSHRGRLNPFASDELYAADRKTGERRVIYYNLFKDLFMRHVNYP